jgi:hypothetical protein
MVPSCSNPARRATAGHHRVQARLDWIGSAELGLDVEPGAEITGQVLKNVASKNRIVLRNWLRLEVT